MVGDHHEVVASAAPLFARSSSTPRTWSRDSSDAERLRAGCLLRGGRSRRSRRSPRRCCGATEHLAPHQAMLRSRSTPLLTAGGRRRSTTGAPAGLTLRASAPRAWNRSRNTSVVVLLRLRANPSGRTTNLATVLPGAPWTRGPNFDLAHRHMLIGASPGRGWRSRRRRRRAGPCPLLARCSMRAASAGRLATQRPTELAVVPPEGGYAGAGPCRMPLLARRGRAGELDGPLLESVAAGVDPASQVRHGPGLQRPPGATGKGHPSSWTKTAPSTSGSGRWPFWPNRRSADVERVVGPGGRQPGQEGADRGRDPGAATRVQKSERLDPGTTLQREVHARPARRSRGRRRPATRWRWRP